MEKVKIKNTSNSRVLGIGRAVNFRHEWPVGSTFDISKDILEQLMYENGFRYMIETGMLYIEDMMTKKELGIEPEDAYAPTNIIVLSDAEKKTYMTTMSFKDFETKVKQLSFEQIQNLAEYAITNRLIDFNKCELLKALCGKDVLAAVRLSKQNKE